MNYDILCLEPLIEFLNAASQLNIACCSKRIYHFLLTIGSPPSYIRLNNDFKKNVLFISRLINESTHNINYHLFEVMKCTELVFSGLLRRHQILATKKNKQIVPLIAEDKIDRLRFQIEYNICHCFNENTRLNMIAIRILPFNIVIYQRRIKSLCEKDKIVNELYDCYCGKDTLFSLYSYDDNTLWNQDDRLCIDLIKKLDLRWDIDTLVINLLYIADLEDIMKKKENDYYDVMINSADYEPLFEVYSEEVWNHARIFTDKIMGEKGCNQMIGTLISLSRYWSSFFHYESIGGQSFNLNPFLKSFIGSMIYINAGEAAETVCVNMYRHSYGLFPSIHIQCIYLLPYNNEHCHIIQYTNEIECTFKFPKYELQHTVFKNGKVNDKQGIDFIRKEFEIEESNDICVLYTLLSKLLVYLPLYSFNDLNLIKCCNS